MTSSQSFHSFQLLEPREEDDLHKSRLLNVEEKPFKRISKRLLAPSSLLTTPWKLPTPPPDSATIESEPSESALNTRSEEWRQFKEDILFDFGAFDSSMLRIQFLLNSNERERQRYHTEKARILETAQQVRDNTAQLRIQLEEAKKTLEQRQKFDELAEKITGNRLLRPREDQQTNLKKLEEECRELERESDTYKVTWAERREQFGRIVEEGMQLRRLIRDEKEEVERREGMADEEDGEVGDVTSRGGQTPRHTSENVTPRHHSARASSPDAGLKPRHGVAGSLPRLERSTSRGPSPAVSERLRLREDPVDKDSDMADETGTTFIHEDSSELPDLNTPRMLNEEAEPEDKMDTT